MVSPVGNVLVSKLASKIGFNGQVNSFETQSSLSHYEFGKIKPTVVP